MFEANASITNHPFEGLFYCLIILSLLMAYMVGANDAANSIGTSYGSKALSLKKALLLGLIFEFIGAAFLSWNVNEAISKLLVFRGNGFDSLYLITITAILISSFLVLAIAVAFGVPISSTHSITGAIIGGGLVELVAQGNKVDAKLELWFPNLLYYFISWLISPALSMGVSILVFKIIHKYLLNSKDPRLATLMYSPLLAGLTVAIYLSFFFCSRFYKSSLASTTSKICMIIFIPILGFLIGIIGKRFYLFYFRLKPPKSRTGKYRNRVLFSLQESVKFWYFSQINNLRRKVEHFQNYKKEYNEILEAYMLQSKAHEKDFSEYIARTIVVSMKKKRKSSTKRKESINYASKQMDIKDPLFDMLPDYDKVTIGQNMPGEENFISLLILSGIGMCIGHGSNDVGNVVGLLFGFTYKFQDGLSEIEMNEAANICLTVGCASAMALGLFISAPKVLTNVSNKIATLTYSSAFAAQFSALFVLLLFTALSLPISTTHCLVFALIGLRFVDESHLKKGEGDTLKLTVIWWIITIPLSLLLSLFIGIATFGILNPSENNEIVTESNH